MKIAIVGYSGSGKSLLASRIAESLNIELLHLDTVHFQENWQRRDYDEAYKIVDDFCNKDNWVIEGNYQKLKMERRFKEADQIIFLNLGRWLCFKRAIKRSFENRNSQRKDLALGCYDKLNPSFIYWLLIDGRSKKHTAFYQRLKEEYPDKFISLDNDQDIENYLATLNKRKH